MLKELCKKDSKWRSIAFGLCKDKSLADDIVQDMYIKASRYDKPLNDGYIRRIIYSLFIDHCRKKPITTPLQNLHFIEDCVSTFEPDDQEFELLERYDSLNWKQKELIQISYDKSLREIEKEYPMINYGYAHREIKKGLKIVLGDLFKDKYKNSNLKHQK